MAITKRFQNLDVKKQQRILNAALKEFAENDYEQASTNRIVQNAGIGKGMLFYYFKNKKELYHYLIDYSCDIIIHEYLDRINPDESDFIERMKQIVRIKMKCYAENPEVFHFTGTFALMDEPDLPPSLQKRYEELLHLGYSKMYANIDTSLFRDDVPVEKTIQIIRWFMEGYENDLKDRLKDQKLTSVNFDPYWEEFFQYMDILKTIFYKHEGDEM